MFRVLSPRANAQTKQPKASTTGPRRTRTMSVPSRASGGFPADGGVAAAVAAASSSSLSRRQDTLSSYDRDWEVLHRIPYRELERSVISSEYGCKVERLFGQNARSRRKWSALLQGESMGLYETKEEAIKRTVCAALVMNDTNHGSGAGLQDPLARASKKRSAISGGDGSSKRAKSGRDRDTSDNMLDDDPSDAPEEFPVGLLDVATTMDNNTLVSLRQPSRGTFQGYCIVCQTNKADLVFEPCQHNVLCEECNKKGVCSKWCPTCRTIITNRIQPSSAIVVRPQVYSAYSFM